MPITRGAPRRQARNTQTFAEALPKVTVASGGLFHTCHILAEWSKNLYFTYPHKVDGRSFAAKFRHLVKTVHPSDRGPYQRREISQAVKEFGVSMSPSLLHALLRGEIQNPKMVQVLALSKFFGVPPSYFFADPSSEKFDEEVALLALYRDRKTNKMQLRVAPHRDDEDVDEIVSVIEDHLRNQSH